MQIQKWAIVNEYGFFTVLQRNDTFGFSSLTFKSKKKDRAEEEDFITLNLL
jgi:hypothetical protein